MLRRALLTLCIMCGLTAAALWWVSRNGEKIIYLDADRSFVEIEMAEMMMRRRVRVFAPGETTGHGLCLTVNDGDLVIRGLELAEVSSLALAPFLRNLRATDQIARVVRWSLPLRSVVAVCGLRSADRGPLDSA